MESPLMCFCDGREIIGAPRDQLTINDVSIPISSRLHPLMSTRFLYLKCPSGWFKSGLPQIWMQHLRSPLPFYWFKRILNSMHAVMNVLRFPQVISVGLYLDECDQNPNIPCVLLLWNKLLLWKTRPWIHSDDHWDTRSWASLHVA